MAHRGVEESDRDEGEHHDHLHREAPEGRPVGGRAGERLRGMQEVSHRAHHQAGEAVHDSEGGEGEVGVEEPAEEDADDEHRAHLRRRVEHEGPGETPQLADAGGGTGHRREGPEVARREEARDDRLHRHAGDEGGGPRRRSGDEPGQQREGDAEGGEPGEGAPRDEHGAAVDHEHAEGERAGDEEGGAQAKDEGRELRLPDRRRARAEEAAVEPVPGRGERHHEGQHSPARR